MVEFIELNSEEELKEAFYVLKELDSRIELESFIASYNDSWSANRRLYGIRQENKLISVAEIWFLITGLNERILWVNAFITQEKYRSKGYGDLLIKELCALAVRMSCVEIRIHAHRNSAMRYWQQKQGFKEFSTVFSLKNII